MFNKWPFMENLVCKVSMAASEADRYTAQLWATLVIDQSLRKRFMRQIEEKHKNTINMLAQIGGEELRRHDSEWKKSIKARKPVMHALSYFQVEQVREMRDLGGPSEEQESPNDKQRRQARVTKGAANATLGLAAAHKRTG
jgi:phosphoenolpyruvate carboxylase